MPGPGAPPNAPFPHPRRADGGLAVAAVGVVLGLAAASATAGVRLAGWERERAQRAVALARRAAAPAPVAAAEAPPLRLSVATLRLVRNQTLRHALGVLRLEPAEIQAVLAALTDHFPFHRARPGDELRVERVEGEKGLRRFTYRQSAADEWVVAPRPDGTFVAEKRAVRLTTEAVRVEVPIRGSMWESLQRAGEEPALAVAAADVLAWDVDFYQDVRAGDRLRVLVEKVYADGKLLRYGDVLAAEYAGSVTGTKRLFRWVDPSGRASYYDDAGNGARRGFLKSPLPFANVTSRFGSRVHPVLGYVRSHQGVDYGAATGTPVWAVGDGVVAQAGWSGGCGRAVTLRHRNGLETVYCHLSAIAVRTGARVAQKQLVGRVGQTGLATGPHLHYAVKRRGAFVNPLRLDAPREAPVPREHRADFEAKTAPLRTRLDGVPIV